MIDEIFDELNYYGDIFTCYLLWYLLFMIFSNYLFEIRFEKEIQGYNKIKKNKNTNISKNLSH